MADMTVEIICAGVTGEVIAAIEVPNGHNGALTGVADLPAGTHDIYLRLSILSGSGASGSINGASLQVITGQIVDSPGCIVQMPPGGG